MAHGFASASCNHPRFLRTLVDPAVDAGAGFGGAAGFLAVAPATPFLIVLIIVLFAGGAGAGFDATVFLTTVAVLPSLDSLILRPVRVAGRERGGLPAVGAAARLALVFAVVPTALEAVEDVVVFLTGAGRAALATVGLATLGGAFMGDAGRAMCDLTGEAVLSRGRFRAFVDVGDRTCAASVTADVGMYPPRYFFFGLSTPWFSLSPSASSSLMQELALFCHNQRFYGPVPLARSGGCPRRVRCLDRAVARRVVFRRYWRRSRRGRVSLALFGALSHQLLHRKLQERPRNSVDAHLDS